MGDYFYTPIYTPKVTMYCDIAIWLKFYRTHYSAQDQECADVCTFPQANKNPSLSSWGLMDSLFQSDLVMSMHRRG
jgi:hypothetical protein